MTVSAYTGRLAPQLAEALADLELAAPPNAGAQSVDARRRLYRTMCRRFDAGRPAGIAVQDSAVQGPARPIPVRLYRPAAAPDDRLLVYLHGGGWVLGDLDSHDAIVADLAQTARVPALAVDYRLAPEHRFPAALDDAGAVLAAVRRAPERFGLVPGARVLVGGDSAGGNLAAVLALNGGADGLLALYPVLDLGFDSASCRALADAPALTVADLAFYRAAYLGPDGDPTDPRAAPLGAGALDRLPPCVLHAAELDPLVDDATRFAARAEAAGSPVRLRVFDGLVHGYLRLAGRVPAAARATASAAADLAWLADGAETDRAAL